MLHNLSAAAVLPAMDANLAAYYLPFGRLPGGEVRIDPRLTWFMGGEPDEQFNGVVRADLDPARLDAAIEESLVPFRRRGVPMLWHIGPSTRPDGLDAALLAHGLEHREDEPGMALDLRSMGDDFPQPAGLTIERVQDEAALHTWVDTWLCGAPEDARRCYRRVYSARGLDPSAPWRCYLGRLDGVPAATCELFFDENIVSVQNVATLHHLRRRGIGMAITLHALREARSAGYKVAVLTASPSGLNVYRRIGFSTYCTFSRYHWHP